MTQLISATQARNRFADIVDRVIYAGEEFIVQKQGKPAVKIGPIDKKNKQNVKIDSGIKFLLKLTKIEAKDLPKDLSQNHDKYAWG